MKNQRKLVVHVSCFPFLSESPEPELTSLAADGSLPLLVASQPIDALVRGSRSNPRAAVHYVLSWRGWSEVLATIVELITVDVVNIGTSRGRLTSHSRIDDSVDKLFLSFETGMRRAMPSCRIAHPGIGCQVSIFYRYKNLDSCRGSENSISVAIFDRSLTSSADVGIIPTCKAAKFSCLISAFTALELFMTLLAQYNIFHIPSMNGRM